MRGLTKKQFIKYAQAGSIKLSPLKVALARLAIAWDRHAPNTVTVNGRPTAIQSAWKALGVRDWEGK